MQPNHWCNYVFISFFCLFFVFLVECDESICSVQHLDMMKAIGVQCFSGVHYNYYSPLLVSVGHQVTWVNTILNLEFTEVTTTSGSRLFIHVLLDSLNLDIFISELETSRFEPQIWVVLVD